MGKEVEVEDENSWADVDSLRTLKTFGWSYAISKTLTEKVALEFGEQDGLDVVIVTPTFVVRPFICPKLPGSVGSTLYFLLGIFSNLIYVTFTIFLTLLMNPRVFSPVVE